MDKKTDTPSSENMAHMEEIEKNYQAFKRLLPTLMKYENHHALMRHEKVIGIYSTARDAVMTGKIFYEDGLFSVQEITAQPAIVLGSTGLMNDTRFLPTSRRVDLGRSLHR